MLKNFFNTGKDLFIDTKVIINTNNVIIYNYVKIIKISSEEIILKKFIIKGSNLKIKELDKYGIIVKGEISNVQSKLQWFHIWI